MTTLKQFDSYLRDDGPAAIVHRQPLMPVEGEDGYSFPRRMPPETDSPAVTISIRMQVGKTLLDRQRRFASQSH